MTYIVIKNATLKIQSVNNSLRNTGRRTGRSKLRVGSPDPENTAKREGVKAVQNLPCRDN